MRYMLLVYPGDSKWDSLSEAEQQAAFAEYTAISELPGVVGDHQLQPSEIATTVTVRDGDTLTTDGPFTETREALGGYYLLDADDLDEAIAIAARVPAARMGGAVEVRPVVER